MVLELKNRPRPRSPSLTAAEAVTNTLAGLISGDGGREGGREGEWEGGRVGGREGGEDEELGRGGPGSEAPATSVHHPTGVHVVQSTAQLHEVPPALKGRTDN